MADTITYSPQPKNDDQEDARMQTDQAIDSLTAATDKVSTSAEDMARSIDALGVSIDALIVQRNELLAALKAVMADIDSGVLVRDITRDDDDGWQQNMIAFVQRLQAAGAAIAKAEGRS